jgi:hypothetical protein
MYRPCKKAGCFVYPNNKNLRRHKSVLQRLERWAHPLTTGAMVVVWHLIQPVIERWHCSGHVMTHGAALSVVDAFTCQGLQCTQLSLVSVNEARGLS